MTTKKIYIVKFLKRDDYGYHEFFAFDTIEGAYFKADELYGYYADNTFTENYLYGENKTKRKEKGIYFLLSSPSCQYECQIDTAFVSEEAFYEDTLYGYYFLNSDNGCEGRDDPYFDIAENKDDALAELRVKFSKEVNRTINDLFCDSLNFNNFNKKYGIVHKTNAYGFKEFIFNFYDEDGKTIYYQYYGRVFKCPLSRNKTIYREKYLADIRKAVKEIKDLVSNVRFVDIEDLDVYLNHDMRTKTRYQFLEYVDENTLYFRINYNGYSIYYDAMTDPKDGVITIMNSVSIGYGYTADVYDIEKGEFID